MSAPIPLRVYVAASSVEIDRAQRWMLALVEAGIDVTSHWPELIKTVGEANPEANPINRRQWSRHDLDEMQDAHLIWFLVPHDSPARGAYFELGVAYGRGQVSVSSGATTQSIFLSLGDEYATDEIAFAEICRLAAGRFRG